VLLTGATGLIGSAIGQALADRGHQVVRVVREPAAAARRWPGQAVVQRDMARHQAPEDWAEALAGIDVVVNAVGILQERGAQTFEALHRRGPLALFEAAARAGVARVVQVSALGADAQAQTAYHRSKRDADEALLQLARDGRLQAVVLQPSLVFSPEGASTAMFATWASLPLIPLPAGGGQGVQPVHLDDVVAIAVAAVEGRLPAAGAASGASRGSPQALARQAAAGGADAQPAATPSTHHAQPAPATPVATRLAVVGPQPLTLRDYLLTLRRGMGLGRGWPLAIPAPLVALAVRLAARLPGALADEDTWRMLQRGNVADAGDTAAWLGRPPRAADTFVPAAWRDALRARAALNWLLPLLRLSVAAVWIVTAIVSAFVWPVDGPEGGLALLAATGIGPGSGSPGWLASREAGLLALYGAAALDGLLGALTLLRPGRWLWRAQMALMGFYTVAISLCLPQFWAHPYGPVLKNLPLLAVLMLLHHFEPVKANKP
jgi:uncharacterized protein YbjT (DUF2867 family)